MRELAIFAKYWEPGRVKTRLAAAIGESAAAEIHRLSLLAILDRFGTCSESRSVVFSPSDREEEFREAVPDTWVMQPQSQGELGERIVAHFTAAAQRGVTSAVILGSDSPTLPRQRIEQAFAALRSADVVAGPSEDGGFYLLGLQLERVSAALLSQWLAEMPWSTEQVWPLLHTRLTAANVRLQVLEPWYDVDTVAELSRLHAELDELAVDDPLWSPLLEAVRAALI